MYIEIYQKNLLCDPKEKECLENNFIREYLAHRWDLALKSDTDYRGRHTASFWFGLICDVFGCNKMF